MKRKVVKLQSVLLLELKVFRIQSVDTINHGLDKLHLRVSQSVLVGNVIGNSSLAAGLTTSSTGLEGESLAPGLKLVNSLLGPSRKVNVDRGPHASAQVGGAGVDVAELLGQLEVLARLSLDAVTDSLDATAYTGEVIDESFKIEYIFSGFPSRFYVRMFKKYFAPTC